MNRLPPACRAGALPVELRSQGETDRSPHPETIRKLVSVSDPPRQRHVGAPPEEGAPVERRGLEPRSLPCEGSVLPLELSSHETPDGTLHRLSPAAPPRRIELPSPDRQSGCLTRCIRGRARDFSKRSRTLRQGVKESNLLQEFWRLRGRHDLHPVRLLRTMVPPTGFEPATTRLIGDNHPRAARDGQVGGDGV